MDYLFILGYGRSGSTLLDWLLDSHPSCLGLGEVGRLPQELFLGKGPSRLCGCGSALSDCPLWRPVVAHALSAAPADLAFDPWTRKMMELVSPFKKGARVLVDSSCRLPRLKRLMAGPLAGEGRVKIVYLTRDARGVAYSASVRGYAKGRKPPLIKASIGWWWRNRQCLAFLEGLPRDGFLHVRYEDLCRDPGAVLRRIQRFAGVEPLGLADNWRETTHHTMAGNIRLRESGGSAIREDLEWVRGLGAPGTLLVEIIAGRLNRRLLGGLGEASVAGRPVDRAIP